MMHKEIIATAAAPIAILQIESDQVVAIRKVNDKFGWMGNMSPHPINYAGQVWRTAEAAFQAARFDAGGNPTQPQPDGCKIRRQAISQLDDYRAPERPRQSRRWKRASDIRC
jgi:hypothetical protein